MRLGEVPLHEWAAHVLGRWELELPLGEIRQLLEALARSGVVRIDMDFEECGLRAWGRRSPLGYDSPRCRLPKGHPGPCGPEARQMFGFES